MANRTIYTRTYSQTSTRQLNSGQGPNGNALSTTSLHQNFRRHAQTLNRQPTALVSVSTRIVDTLRRALELHYRDREKAENIWIAFIEVPDDSVTGINLTPRIHSARDLAEICQLLDPCKFSHEFVFEWAIPRGCVLHEVSLQTLQDRGLQKKDFIRSLPDDGEWLRSTGEIRECMAQSYEGEDPEDIGISLGVFARLFGARAPLVWIALQLYHDCVWSKVMPKDKNVVLLKYAHGVTEYVRSDFFVDLDEGVCTSLNDWWLADLEFFENNKEYELGKAEKGRLMRAEWKGFRRIWEDRFLTSGDSRNEVLNLRWEMAMNRMVVEHEKARVEIERWAVEIGL